MMTTPLLTRILQGFAPSQFILVEDSVGNDGHLFFHCLVQTICQGVDRVDFVTADCMSPSFLEKYLPTLKLKFQIHKIYEDPFGWDADQSTVEASFSASARTLGHLRYDTDLDKYLANRPQLPSTTSMVVLDTLSTMLLQLDLSETSRILAKLIQKDPRRRLVCLLHADVHDDRVIDTMEYMANTVLRLDSDDPSLSTVKHKFSTGKISKEAVKYTMCSDRLIFTELSKPILRQPEAKHSTGDDTTADQFASSLTFNVSLKEAEKRSRANLVLPYERVVNQAPSGGGRILYEPDEADDIDEEDPDEDLDV